MSIESSFDIPTQEIVTQEVINFYTDSFEEKKSENITQDEKPLAADVFFMDTNGTTPYDKLKENSSIEREKILKSFSQVEIHD